jgi:RimJ/RimL family protein N-acetyltransferase
MPTLPTLRLRLVRKSDSALLNELATPEVSGEWDSFDDPPEEMLRGSHYGGGSRIIELLDGTEIGAVTWIQIPYGPNRRSLAWSIGITVLVAHRGHHYGAAAQRLLAEELLNKSDANRVQADTDVGNLAEQRSLEYAGFSREGVLRGAQWRRGTWNDRVMYGFLRREVSANDTIRRQLHPPLN